MNISVQGSRASVTDWEAARNLPAEQLPRLTPQQREVAGKLGIPEQDYARSVLAGQRTMDKLVAKTERFARYLQGNLQDRTPGARIESVTLDTWEERFEVTVSLGGRSFPLRVAEDIVDDYFERGSAEMQARLERILALATQAQVA